MGYVFLSVALLAGALKGFCGKKTSAYVSTYSAACFANFIRMVMCVFIGAALTFLSYGISGFRVSLGVILISLMSGASSAGFVVSWLICVKKGSYMMLDVFLMLGVVIPLFGGMLSGEAVSLRVWAGVALLVVATTIMCSYNNSIKEKMSIKSIVLLIVCGVFNGICDFSQKLFTVYSTGASALTFNFYSYIAAAAVLFVCYLLFAHEGRAADTLNIKGIMGYVSVMSICLFANSFFQTKAAEILSAAQLFPLSRGAGLILSAAMSAVFFKERLTLKCIIGMVLSFIALLIINL